MAGLNKVENMNNDLLLSIIHSFMVNNLCKPGVKCVLLFLKRGEVSSLLLKETGDEFSPLACEDDGEPV